jgi:hypothetical protein
VESLKDKEEMVHVCELETRRNLIDVKDELRSLDDLKDCQEGRDEFSNCQVTTTYCKNFDVLFAVLWTKLSILSQNRGNL